MCQIHSKKSLGKVGNRGDLCIFVSYPEDHGFDVYQLFNIDAKKIVESRDVRWLGKFLNELNNNQQTELKNSDFEWRQQ
jgi:hypothetical protein